MLEEEFEGVINEECGVVAICGRPEAARLASLALHALQHRGQESVGIATLHEGALHVRRAMGKVGEAVEKGLLDSLPGGHAIGHVRYSTSGGSALNNAQPIVVETRFGTVGLAHNGNLTNALAVRDDLERTGSVFLSTSDTEVIAHLIERSRRPTLHEAVIDALGRVEGAYSLVILGANEVIAVRDPAGVRPLVLGDLQGTPIVASETCALDLLRARHVREIEPGEMMRIDLVGRCRSDYPLRDIRPAPCVFELVYFARPDSIVFGRSVYEARMEMGRHLAREHAVDADIVIPVPDSGTPAALGYARESGIPFELGLIRSHYIGRTFIEPTNSIRHLGVKLKLNPVPSLIRNRRVVVVDDSIVRGTTSRKIAKMLREAGASEVHLRVASPPTRWPCFYGIDTPVRSQLIAATHTHEEIERYLTVDSLGYASLEGLRDAVGLTPEAAHAGRRFCEACFTGDYPVGSVTPR